MSYPEQFTGFGVYSPQEWNHPKKHTFAPKNFYDGDIDIKIDFCGVCGSDVHCAHGNWGPSYSPIIVGHEIIGKVVKAGPKSNHKIGDRVGVGAQAFSCGECKSCKSHNEQYCTKAAYTYFGQYPDGYNTQGGYASHIRLPGKFAFRIPEALDSKHAAPLMCGGITCYSPLIRNGAGPGKKVAISGIGGIGHMAIMFAKALGAEVYAISRSDSKKEDALKLGADHYIATNEKGWETKYADTLDIILNCGSSWSGIDINLMLSTLTAGGKFVSISAPAADETLAVSAFPLGGKSISQSILGSGKEIEELLQLCAEKNIKPWIEEVPISADGTHEVLTRADKVDVRYRFVLTDFEKEFSDAY